MFINNTSTNLYRLSLSSLQPAATWLRGPAALIASNSMLVICSIALAALAKMVYVIYKKSKAEKLFKNGQYNEAIDIYKTLIPSRLKIINEHVHEDLGCCYYELDDHANALNHLKQSGSDKREIIFKIAVCSLLVNNQQDSFKYFKLAADQGDAGSRFMLAVCYTNGSGTEKSLEEAFKYFKLAADQGLVNARYKVALCYTKGKGTEKSLEEAFKYFKLAADQGQPFAQYRAGCCYMYGDGVEESPEQSFRYLKLAADQSIRNNLHENDSSIIDAPFLVSDCYKKGYGIEASDNLAFNYLKIAREQIVSLHPDPEKDIKSRT